MAEPRSWGEFAAELVKLIGQTADTGGSQTEGTMMAKGNAILEAIKNVNGVPFQTFNQTYKYKIQHVNAVVNETGDAITFSFTGKKNIRAITLYGGNYLEGSGIVEVDGISYNLGNVSILTTSYYAQLLVWNLGTNGGDSMASTNFGIGGRTNGIIHGEKLTAACETSFSLTFSGNFLSNGIPKAPNMNCYILYD